jgi:hypothetical protein
MPSHNRNGPHIVEGSIVPEDQMEDLAPPLEEHDLTEDPYSLLPPMGMIDVPLDEPEPEEETHALLDDGQKSVNRST